tara:strand:- start:2275 stop:2634 length:360 start_codon:yes stop_codon:yes gene_type:complete
VISRKDKVDDHINKHTKELQSINQKVLDCGCAVDCSSHVFARSQVDLTQKLMEQIQKLYMERIDAKMYTTDVTSLLNHIEKFAEYKVQENVKRKTPQVNWRQPTSYMGRSVNDIRRSKD